MNALLIHQNVQISQYTEKGKWSLNDEGELALVTFEYIDITEPEFSEVYENGDLIFQGKAYIEDGNLIIEENDPDFGDDVKYIFVKN